VRFQSPSLTTCALHHALTKHIGSTQCVQRLVTTYRAAPFHGHALWLELYRDPGRLPPLVPDLPGFPSDPCRITAASSTHHRGTRLTLPSQPCVGFSPVRHIQGWRGYPRARFDVAQHRFFALRPRWFPKRGATGCDVRRSRSRESHPTALLVCRTSPIRGMRLQAMPSNLSRDGRGRLSCRCRSWWRQDRCDGLRVRGLASPAADPSGCVRGG
jgi:hypothetical protein